MVFYRPTLRLDHAFQNFETNQRIGPHTLPTKIISVNQAGATPCANIESCFTGTSESSEDIPRFDSNLLGWSVKDLPLPQI
jgi:hypothetical protein